LDSQTNQDCSQSPVAASPANFSVGRPAPEDNGFRHLLSRLRSYLFFDPLIYAYTIFLGIISLFCSLFDKKGRVQHRLATLWSWLILKTTVSPLTVRGLEKIDTSKPHLYVVNHLSAMDIPMLFVGLPFQFRIVAKKELFRYPFVGWHLKRSGQVRIDQQNPSASIGSLKSAVKTLKDGMPLIIFPEGGRSSTGQVKPFLPGAFFLAIKAKVDIVPMALVGSYEMLPMNTFHIRPRSLELLVGDAIDVSQANLHDMPAIAEHAKAAVENLYYSRALVPDPRKR
jgi:1-acyl-sn-glycerol-3-phosphate acyltransferase